MVLVVEVLGNLTQYNSHNQRLDLNRHCWWNPDALNKRLFFLKNGFRSQDDDGKKMIVLLKWFDDCVIYHFVVSDVERESFSSFAESDLFIHSFAICMTHRFTYEISTIHISLFHSVDRAQQSDNQWRCTPPRRDSLHHGLWVWFPAKYVAP